MSEKTPKLDLLIIDIDDTFVYHLTVAAANKLFLQNLHSMFGKKLNENELYTAPKTMLIAMKVVMLNFFRFKPTKQLIRRHIKLKYAAVQLYIMYIYRQIHNKLSNKIINSGKFINIWADAVVSLGITSKDYEIQGNLVKKAIDKKILSIYNSLRKQNPTMKVLAMTQSFVVNENTIKEILRINIFESNKFVTDKDSRICGYLLSVKSYEDKKRIAQDVVDKYKAKKIGLFVEDYDDYQLLSLENLRFVLYKKRLKRFIKHDDNLTLLSF